MLVSDYCYTDMYSSFLPVLFDSLPIIVVSIYIPPNIPLGDFYKYLRALQSFLQSHANYQIFVVGDFNLPRIAWVDTHPTFLGSLYGEHVSYFLNFLLDNSLSQHVSFPTRASNYFDLGLTNSPVLSLSKSQYALFSDKLRHVHTQVSVGGQAALQASIFGFQVKFSSVPVVVNSELASVEIHNNEMDKKDGKSQLQSSPSLYSIDLLPSLLPCQGSPTHK